MISIATAQNWGGGKSYGFASAENIDILKKRLIDSGHEFVHIVQKDPWDDSWESVKSSIPVSELSESDIALLDCEQDSLHSCQRFLVCRL
jgi:hypothetical protein